MERKCGNCTKLKNRIKYLEEELEILAKIETAKAVAKGKAAETFARLELKYGI